MCVCEREREREKVKECMRHKVRENTREGEGDLVGFREKVRERECL